MNLVTKLSVLVLSLLAVAAGTAKDASSHLIPPIDPRVLGVGPDLVVSGVTQDSVMITNRGNRLAGPFFIYVQGALPSGACSLVPATWNLRFGLPSGASITLHVPRAATNRLVQVDQTNNVHETNESNNLGVIPGDPLGC